jgi:hypothetical protein
MTSFSVSNVQIKEVYVEKISSMEKYLKTQNVVKSNNGRVLKSTCPDNAVSPAFGNGFVSAAFRAYSSHLHLVIKPDDIWIAITTAFAQYVDFNAEKMRSLFVSHEGKEDLEVVTGGNIHTVNYDDIIDQISVLIGKKTKDDIKSWVEPNFSTTGPKERFVGKVVLMGAMKNYFTYKICIECGLKDVTLEGTLEDWKEIRSRIEKFSDFAIINDNVFQRWYNMLVPILDEFIASYSGSPNTDFWNRICTKTGGGSGPSYLEGWILAFIPFNRTNGKWQLNDKVVNGSYGQIDTSKIPASAVEVPVLINDNGRKYKTILYAGSLVSTFEEKESKMGSSLDWALIDITQ